MGHKAVKAALVAKLMADLPGWTDQGPWVARGGVMPADSKRWPFVLVRTTRLQSTTHAGRTSAICIYRCVITVGARSSSGDRDASLDDATAARDDLIDAVRYALQFDRTLAAGIQVTNGEMVGDTGEAVLEGSGPAIAVGELTFTVSAEETIPAPSDAPPVETIDDVDLSVAGLAADQSLPTT